MAKSDRAAFLGVVRQTEAELGAVMAKLAHDAGDIVLRAAGPDGTIPIERLEGVQRQARMIVDAAFIGPVGQPFGEGNEGMAPYPRIIETGQRAMLELALERTGRILDERLPQDVQAVLSAQTFQEARKLPGSGEE